MATKRLLTAAMFVVIVLCLALVYVYLERNQKVKVLNRQANASAEAVLAAVMETHATRRSQAHYQHLYNMYAATERHRQYGVASDNVALFYDKARDFIPIEDVTEQTICPKPVKQLPDGFTFYGIRNIVLNRRDDSALFYSVSYQGNHKYIRDKDEFDSLIDLGRTGDKKIVHMKADQAANLMAGAPRKMTRNGSYITPFSFNTGDVNKDGTADFFYGGRLHLSGGGTYKPISDPTLDGREVIFFHDAFLSPNGDTIERWTYDNERLVQTGATKLTTATATDRPFTILPLEGAVTPLADVIVITASTFDFYVLQNDKMSRVLSVPTTAPHSVIVGARGDFDGDGIDDLWLTESRWRNSENKMNGRAILLGSRKFNIGARRIEDLASFILYGSEKYTDYDGIGTTLSPVAGDFDGDGKPDLSVSGHINMNEAGALYIVRGKDIVGKTEMNVADAAVVRIVGRPVSNLAPPFVHYDMPSPGSRSKLVVTADNDLCAGIAGGAIYIVKPF